MPHPTDPNAHRAELVIRTVLEQDATPAAVVQALIAAGLLTRASDLPMGETRLAEIRSMQVALPAPLLGHPWRPITTAEQHLLSEAGRHSDARAELTREVDRLRGALARALGTGPRPCSHDLATAAHRGGDR